MDLALRGKAALITGGASGIGLGIAQALAAEGVNIAIASRDPDPAVIDELRATGVRCVRLPCDVSQEAQVVAMVAQAIDELGQLDFYVNNAAWTWHRPITQIDADSWYSTLNTNLSACVWACREVGKHLIARRQGGIVIIGSTARFTVAYREAAYRLSKVALHAYMQNLALEMAPYGIRVNMVTPGHYKTRMTGNIPAPVEDQLRGLIPAHRFGQPSEVGNAVAVLLSDRVSGYTYGADLVIDGGLSLQPLPLLGADEIYQLNLPIT
ncbi:MAG: SDR family oxidoreductase [Caldilineaceae bacterium]|nr:SDR family oxidoreductase [Caldilineaceae bacterium]